MLQLFHGFKKSFLLILMVVVVAFVMTGFGLNLGSPKQNVAAITINDDEISFDRFYKERQGIEQRYRQVFGDRFDEIAPNLKLNQQIVDRLIAGHLTNNFASELGMVPSKLGIQQMILASGLFQNGYDEQIYKAYLQQIGMSSQEFEAELQSAALTDQFSNLVQDLSVASKLETESFLNQIETTYDVDYIEFDPKGYLGAVTEPSEDELKEYYESHASDYETQAAVAYHYLVFDPKDHLAAVEILPEDIELYYSEHQSEFKIPEAVRARHIQFSFGKDDTPQKMAALKEEAEKVRAKAASGTPFDELARANSADFSTKDLGGDLGFIERANTSLPKEVVDEAFRLNEGEISEVVSTDYGYEIIKVEEKREDALKELSEVKEEIERKLRIEQAPAYASSKAHDFYDAWIAADTELDQFALSEEVVSRVTAEPLEKGQDPEGFKGLTSRVMQDHDLDRQVIEMGDLTVLVDIKEFFPEEIPALENVKPQVATAWKEYRAESMAEDAADNLVTALQDGAYKNIAEAAKTLKLKLMSKDKVGRSEGDLPFSDSTVQADLLTIFAPLQAPKKSYEVEEKYYVFQVKELNPPDVNETAKRIESARSQESQRLGRMLLTSITNKLKAEADIDVSSTLELDS